MASEAAGLPALFVDLRQQGRVVVEEMPKLDLDLYIQNYTGRTRLDRLIFIGRTCVPLCVEALKAAIAEAKKGKDVQRYRDAWELLVAVTPNEPEAVLDKAWIDKTTRANQAETQRLENQAKSYKNNLIKESIRMGNEDLGRHFEQIGELANASDYYNRMRADVTTVKQIVDVGKHLANVSAQRKDWSMVLGSLTKITGVQSEEDKGLQPYVKILQGIAHMGMEKFEEGAKSFLGIDATKDAKEASDYNSVASPNDVAVYGGLLALATMDRQELQAKVLNNSNFRTFLELEPHIRKAISLFVNGRYSACLSILESYRPDYLLDIYLQQHLPAIYGKIRSKCIVQYFTPFSCVTLASLNDAFAVPGQSIQRELIAMIKSKALNARIDTINQLLVAVSPNQRLALQAKALESTRAYELEAMERMRHMSLSLAGLDVKGAKRILPSNGGGGPEGVSDVWYDDNVDPGAMAPSQVAA